MFFSHLYCFYKKKIKKNSLSNFTSKGFYHHITLVQGNVGSAIELGTYGIGIRSNTVKDAHARGIYIHRIAQADGQ